MLDKDLKIKSLHYFANKPRTDSTALEYLENQFSLIEQSINERTEYDILSDNLDLLNCFVFWFPSQSANLLESVINRILGTSSDMETCINVRSEESLIKALDVLTRLRYLEQDKVTTILITLAKCMNSRIRKHAIDCISKLSVIDLIVFKEIGIKPQQDLIRYLKKFTEDELIENIEALLVVLRGCLTTNIESHEASYDAVTFKSASIPAIKGLKEVRSNAIDFLIKIYTLLKTKLERHKVLKELKVSIANFYRTPLSSETLSIINDNKVKVLTFYADLVPLESFDVIELIEKDSFWLFYHSKNEDICLAALKVESEIEKHGEYKLYRSLAIYREVEDGWKIAKNKGSNRHLPVEKKIEKVLYIANSILVNDLDDWKKRILGYLKIESNTYGAFSGLNVFLKRISARFPNEFLNFLDMYSVELQPVANLILEGASTNCDTEIINNFIIKWISTESNLFSVCLYFSHIEMFNFELFDLLINKAKFFGNVPTLNLGVRVIAKNYRSINELDDYFISLLNAISKSLTYTWVNYIQFESNTESFIETLNDNSIDCILTNLVIVNDLGFDQQRLLQKLAEKHPLKIIQYFKQRIDYDSNEIKGGEKRYTSVPYEFYELSKCFANTPRLLVNEVFSWYNPNDYIFQFTGGRLLKNSFPEFSTELQNSLFYLLNSDTKKSLEFIEAVLNNYEGKPIIFPFCKRVISSINDKELSNHLMRPMINTGVVIGEFGFAEAYENKIEMLNEWLLSKNEFETNFANNLILKLKRLAQDERKRGEENIALRKHKYGE